MSLNPSKQKLPGGLRFSIRLSAFYALTLLVGYLILFTAGDYIIRSSIAGNEREIIAERLTEYKAWFRAGQFNELRSRFQEQSSRGKDLLFVRIAGRGLNSLLFSSPRGSALLDENALRKLAESGPSVVATLKSPGKNGDTWTVASSYIEGGYLIQAGRISTDAFEPANQFRRFILWALVPVSLLAIAGGFWLSFHTMKPVRELTSTAAGIVETGDLARRVRVKNEDGDLAAMGLLFNRMLDRNQALIESMKQSLDNTAHDLRTPMSRMRASAETALQSGDDMATLRDALADCMEESDRVLTMLNTLMDIAEAETGVMPLNRVEIPLEKLVREVVDVYELIAEEKGVQIRQNIPESLIVKADRARLQQVIANLVDNAIKYSREQGGEVEIRAEENETEWALHIADDGIGISSDALPKIWERLFRADESRSQRGLGLGLSFVKAIVDAHGGRVEVESEEGKGARFSVYFPK